MNIVTFVLLCSQVGDIAPPDTPFVSPDSGGSGEAPFFQAMGAMPFWIGCPFVILILSVLAWVTWGVWAEGYPERKSLKKRAGK